MRRSVGLVAVVTALASAVPADAALVPVDSSLPRVRSGTLTIPRNQAVRVIVGLAVPPLARLGRRFTSMSSRSHLARIEAEQRLAAQRIRAAIPSARIGRRFQVVLNGLTVSVPATKLPRLVGLGVVRKVYPSIRYTLNTDRSPSVIHAGVLQQTAGVRGEGIKIGIVDDGVDNAHPFLSPAGYSYPAGFPKGGRRWTSPKVIVARVFPGPNSGPAGRRAVDREVSFHGTHVAGIAAGNAGTCTQGGRDHPPTCGLSGVAPRAYIGNYRVFTVPTDIGHIANTPEIAAAFESAIRDGMDVINFSGGGAEFEPANDAMVDVIRNVVAAGVIPVISAGNDRDDFGLGTIGSPGTAPEAITVAAVSNTHVFEPTMSVRAAGAPDTLRGIPVASAGGSRFPGSITRTPQRLIDVASLGVDPRLCGPDDDTNNETKSPLGPGSLSGLVALVSRGHCTFASKALRAQNAGAIALVVVDNRPGTANSIPIELALPAGMISDLDGARLRSYLATTGGAAEVTIGSTIRSVEDGRGGIVTSFTGGGPTAFDDLLKPDVSAPGGQILSSTLPEFTGDSPFAVFDGTSMASPHVAAAAALLLQLHPAWTPQQVKSALVSTAGPAWGNTARTEEAPVILGGAGVVDLPEAAKPLVFTTPTGLSFGELNVNAGADSKALLALVADAGEGAGTWHVQLALQASTNGASVELPPTLVVPPGGEVALAAVARARADAEVGENYGFVLLRKGNVTRKLPFEFFVGRPQLQRVPARQLVRFQFGNTLNGENRVNAYCCPAAPFGLPADYTGPPMEQPGAEKLYVMSIQRPVVNVGVSVQRSSQGSEIDPWFLGSPNERDVQGYAGTPVNVNALMFDYQVDVGAAGASFPKVQRFYVSVDSNADAFSHHPFPGTYVLRSWVNDVRPPRIRLVTKRVASGRPTIVARVLDGGSGVDPLSLVLAYRGVLVGASRYDAESGIALFPLPLSVELPRGPTRAIVTASDFQEAKNVNSVGDDVLPNTAFRPVLITGVAGPALTWVTPAQNECVARTAPLVVVASSTKRIRSVRFLVDGKQIDVDRKGAAGVYSASWATRLVPAGRHELTAIAVDVGGQTLAASRTARVCR